MKQKHVAIIGAGPGGLTSAMILARRGFRVSVFEKEEVVGGRSAAIKLGPYKFDTGPTFLMMTFLLREMFAEAGRDLQDYCEVVPLEPMYKLSFSEKQFYPSTDIDYMRRQIADFFPGNEEGLERFMKREKLRYEKMFPCLQKDYSSFGSLFSLELLKALPHLSLTKTLYGKLSEYFSDDILRTSFTFQAKYLGMSPWECPAAFTMIPYVERAFGIDHVIGGLSTICEAMSEVAIENGAQLHLGSPVRRIITENRCARGVELEDGSRIDADVVVINADFGYAMENLFDSGVIRKYSPEKLRKKKYSCSTFMMYLGIDAVYDEPFHQVVFAEDYKSNVEDIVKGSLSDDMSVYIRNASSIDKSVAPEGHSALYVLVPVSNTSGSVDWTPEVISDYRRKVLERIEQRTSMKDLQSRIREEKIITPKDWEEQYSLFLGATFNLGHNISQMLYFRPRNRFEEVKNCYLAGGGTHPGSGLPTIYESARISANLICKDLGITDWDRSVIRNTNNSQSKDNVSKSKRETVVL